MQEEKSVAAFVPWEEKSFTRVSPIVNSLTSATKS